jgi:hypothetical protein
MRSAAVAMSCSSNWVQALCGGLSTAGNSAARLSRRPINRELQMFHNPMFRNPKSWAVVVMAVLILGMSLSSVRAGDKEDLVGRWDHCRTDESYIRFNADGTYKWVALYGNAEGKYRLLPGGVIEFDTPGLIYGRNQTEIKYRLNGDTLELKVFGDWVKYPRAK